MEWIRLSLPCFGLPWRFTYRRSACAAPAARRFVRCFTSDGFSEGTHPNRMAQCAAAAFLALCCTGNSSAFQGGRQRRYLQSFASAPSSISTQRIHVSIRSTCLRALPSALRTVRAPSVLAAVKDFARAQPLRARINCKGTEISCTGTPNAGKGYGLCQ